MNEQLWTANKKNHKNKTRSLFSSYHRSWLCGRRSESVGPRHSTGTFSAWMRTRLVLLFLCLGLLLGAAWIVRADAMDVSKLRDDGDWCGTDHSRFADDKARIEAEAAAARAAPAAPAHTPAHTPAAAAPAPPATHAAAPHP